MGQFARSQNGNSANKLCHIVRNVIRNKFLTPKKARHASLPAIAPHSSQAFPFASLLQHWWSGFAHSGSSKTMVILLPSSMYTVTYLHPACSFPGQWESVPTTHVAAQQKHNDACWENILLSSAFPVSINCFSRTYISIRRVYRITEQ